MPDPTPQWGKVKSTYDHITAKLNEKKVKDEQGNDTAVDVTLAQRQAAITYWIHRLTEDSASIAAGGKPFES